MVSGGLDGNVSHEGGQDDPLLRELVRELLNDLRQATRVFMRNPWTTAVMVLAMALGIGVNIGAFTVAEAMLLHPLPYPELHNLFVLWESPTGMPRTRQGVAPANYFDVKEQSRSFKSLAAYRRGVANLTGADGPESVRLCRATPEFFHVLGRPAATGRAFQSDDAEVGRDNAAMVAIVSHGFWKRRLGGAADAIGRQLSLNGAAHTIIGIMPESFNYPLENEIWTPLAFTTSDRHDRQSQSLSLLGRLEPGVSIAEARSEVSAVARRLAAEHPETNERCEIHVAGILEVTNEMADRFMVVVQATALFVLLLALANVANLLLARMSDRRRELAIRTAIGATRAKIARMLLTESVLLALAAGGLGLILAWWSHAAVPLLIPPEVYESIAGLRDMRINGWVVLFTLGISLISALGCATPAVIHAFRGDASASESETLKQGRWGLTAGSAHTRMRTALAVAEVALAMMLLVGAGVMVRTFKGMLNRAVFPGYDTTDVLTMETALPESKYPSASAQRDFYLRVLEGVNRIATTRAAALNSPRGHAEGVYIEGRPDPRPDMPRPEIHSVGGDYFGALSLPIVQGRSFASWDGADTPPVVVVSQSVAQSYWPDSNPIGARLKMSKNDSAWLTVVGVCGDAKDWFSSSTVPRLYIPFPQSPGPYAAVLVRTAVPPEKAARGVQNEILKVDVAQPVFHVTTMEKQRVNETSGVRVSAISMSAYALIAAFLAISGVYAVMAYSVSQRTHEIGVRMALGADRAKVVRMILAQTAHVGAIGLGIGIPVAVGLMSLLSSFLYGVVETEAWVVLLVALMMAVSALVAGYAPALRAARVDPLTALRSE